MRQLATRGQARLLAASSNLYHTNSLSSRSAWQNRMVPENSAVSNGVASSKTIKRSPLLLAHHSYVTNETLD